MFDVLAFVNDYGIEFQTKGANVGRGWIGICCPHCYDQGFHGGLALATGIFSCWKCGGHSLFSTIKGITNLSDYEVRGILDTYGDRNSIVATLNSRIAKASSITLPGGPLEEHHCKYLRKRHFDPVLMESKYKIQGTGFVGEWAYRIILPVFQDNRLVTFTSRDITGQQEMRYKNLPIEKSVVDIKKTLYNDGFVSGDCVGVCEGCFDAINMGDGFVATMGTSMSPTQIQLLSKYKRVVFLFDPEKTAQARAKKYGEQVAALGSEVEIVDIGGSLDPGGISKDEVGYIRKELGFSI